MPSGRSILRIAAVATAAFLLAGCPALGPRGEPPPTIDRAERLSRQGNHAEAARVYEDLAAQNVGANRTRLLLLAARSYLAARDPGGAARMLADIGPDLTPDQAFERQMLSVELALISGQPQQAWQTLETIQEPADASAAIRYLRLKRQVALASGRALQAVVAQTALERRLTTRPEDLRESRLEMLTALRDAAERGVRIEPRAATDPVARGWLELASLAAAAAQNPTMAIPQIEAWRARYPGHPASDVVRTELLGLSDQPEQTAPHVALLLPLSGRASGAAVSIRDGFMTAYYMTPAERRPRVRIYDTGESGVAEVILRAVQDGAQLIVGPLLRDEVMAAADLAIARPPMLALNFLPADRAAPPAFYQFALSPEDEARQVARRLLSDGLRQGVALVPRGDWGTRVLTAFRQELEAAGGTLLDEAMYDPSMTDYAAPITEVLGLTDSQARRRRLESVLGTRLQMTPRRRGDIEFIFAAGQADAARLLRPQLRFHYASDLPTYATSDAFEPHPSANEDLDGLIFPDMPWMLGGERTAVVRALAQEAWPGGGPRRNRLYAFGFDAFQLALALRNHRGGDLRLNGLTGRLGLDAEGRVHRDLDWARLVGGEPQPLPPTLAPSLP